MPYCFWIRCGALLSRTLKNKAHETCHTTALQFLRKVSNLLEKFILECEFERLPGEIKA